MDPSRQCIYAIYEKKAINYIYKTGIKFYAMGPANKEAPARMPFRRTTAQQTSKRNQEEANTAGDTRAPRPRESKRCYRAVVVSR